MFMFVLPAFISCSKEYLDKQPLASLTPDSYLLNDAQLSTYAIKLYDVIPHHSSNYGADIFVEDRHTDNMANIAFDSRYVPGQYKVSQTGGSWDFTNIYQCNYFIQTVMPRYKAGKLTGSATNIKDYIGEVYFLRAFNYFTKLQALGDFPIVRTNLPLDKKVLIEASKRSPRNEVARFIISDLDTAAMFLSEASIDGKGNRLNKNCALLFKSRVALYEATWEKYFKGTAFVPKGTGWPGADKDYNKSYVFPSGSIDGEISYFLDQAISSSKAVADAVTLTTNTKTIQKSLTEPPNPYFDMFSSVDLSGFNEVLLWKAYSVALRIVHLAPEEAQQTGNQTGLTRGFVDNFLMANGLPVYDPASGYLGDDSVQQVVVGRDNRLRQFMKVPGDINILIFNSSGAAWSQPIELKPGLYSGGNTQYTTGYQYRKGLSYDQGQDIWGKGYTGCIIFRGVEAYLNYIEAYYEKNHSIDGVADGYWRAIRDRGGVNPDYNKTIAATDVSKEAPNDWGAYSGGQLIDATLYSIRRERRCELICEGFRNMDLTRWRAKDQMITTPYHIEGFKLWGPMLSWYDPAQLIHDQGDASIVSSPTRSIYFRPYEKTPTSLVYNGYKWNLAHYLEPIAVEHFQDASETGDVTTSTIYQNPGWPITAGAGPN